MNGPYAFISYAREDEQVVGQLDRILQLNGIATWLDRTEVHVGDDLQKRVFAAVDRASWILPIISRNTARSGWVLKEYLRAVQQDRSRWGATPDRPRQEPTQERVPQSPVRHIYPVVITEPADPDPRSVLRTSWFGDHLDPVVNASVPRDRVEASQVRDLIASIQQHWPPNYNFSTWDSKTTPEAKSRKLLWSTFPRRFYDLECRFRDLASDSKTAVWVVVGLPSAGRSALVEWLQCRCPYATRIDAASDRNGTLEQRIVDVVVDVLMFDNVWGESDMLSVLSAVERLHPDKRLLVITCAPSLLAMVEERLRRIGACYSVDYERGVSRDETLRLVAAHSEEKEFRSDLRELARLTEDRRRDKLGGCIDSSTAPDDMASPPESTWAHPKTTREYLWSKIVDTWLPFNPNAIESAEATPAAGESGSCPLQMGRERIANSFSTSLYEAEHRLQQFWEPDGYSSATGLPLMPQWKLDYIQRCFLEGLSGTQQEAIRNVVRFGDGWCVTPSQQRELELLEHCFIVRRLGRGYHLADRIFAQYFVPPLVVHHLSDFHTTVGGRAELPATLRCYFEEVLSDEARCPHLLVVSGDVFGEVYSVGDGDDKLLLREWFTKAAERLRRKRHPFICFDPRVSRIAVVGGNQDLDPLTESDALAVTDTLEHPTPFWAAPRRRRSLQKLFEGNLALHPYLEDALESEPVQCLRVGPVCFTLLDSCAFGVDDTDQHSTGWWLDLLYGLVAMSERASAAPLATTDTPENGALQALLRDMMAKAPHAARFFTGMYSLVSKDRKDERKPFLDKVMRAIGDVQPGYVSRATLARLQDLLQREYQPGEGTVRLAVLHHPLTSAPRDYSGFSSELRNAGRVREVLVNGQVAVALHGHLHMHWADELRSPQRSSWVLRTLGAPAFSGSHENDAFGFNELRIRWEGVTPKILQRAVTRHAGAWVPASGYEYMPGSTAGSVLVPP